MTDLEFWKVIAEYYEYDNSKPVDCIRKPFLFKKKYEKFIESSDNNHNNKKI